MTQSYNNNAQPLTRFQIESRLVAFRSMLDKFETGENHLTFEGYSVLFDSIKDLENMLLYLD